MIEPYAPKYVLMCSYSGSKETVFMALAQRWKIGARLSNRHCALSRSVFRFLGHVSFLVVNVSVL